MLSFKKIRDILIVFIISISLGYITSTVLNDVIGIDLNNSFLYKSNYNQTSDKIVIVKIDNKSLDKLQKTDLHVLAFSKSVYANLIDKLEGYGVGAIGVDIVFANAASDADFLAQTLLKYKNVVIGAKIGESGNEENDRVLPLDNFKSATWGSIDFKLKKNTLNRFAPQYTLDTKIIEAMSISLYRKFIGDTSGIGKIVNGYYQINPIKKMPLTDTGDILIKFFNEPGKYKNFSLTDVLDGKVDQSEFKGKIVLIGEYGTLIHDSHFSPLDSSLKMPGVEFHANALDSIIQNRFITEQSSFYKFSTIFLIIIIFAGIFYLLSLKFSVGIVLLYLFALLIFGRYLLYQTGLLIDVFSYYVYGISVFVVTYSYKFFIVDKNKRYLEHAFGHYISPEIVSKIAEDSNALKLGGEKRNITIFFSDIVGFTTISEMLGAERVFQLLSEYLSEMTNILINNKGTLDKYIGDAVMGFFNAPLTIEFPEILACVTALEQQDKIQSLNERWRIEGYPPISMRIGIATGEAMVGNIGSKDRFNYTVIGDHVNLASRLEGVNKEYLTKICVSEDTFLKARYHFIFRELDTIKVKGKTNGVKIYELVGSLNNANIDTSKIANYEKGLKFYYIGKYADAKIIFESISGDLPSSIMVKRCQDAIDGKIIVKNGIYEFKTK